MGYLFLTLALFASTVKGYCGKRSSDCVHTVKDNTFANMLRMCVCIPIGFFSVAFTGGFSALAASGSALFISFLSGLGAALSALTWFVCVQRGAFMLVDVFMMLGMAVPIAGSAILFDESVRRNQWIGFALLFAAVLLLCSYSNSIKTRLNFFSILLLCTCGFFGGLADFSQKLWVETVPQARIETYNFYTYVFAALILFLFFVFQKREEGAVASMDKKYVLVYMPIMAVSLFLSSLFKTYAARHLHAAVLYPVMLGAALMISTLMAAIFFGEKLRWKSILGIFLAFVALLIINLL